MTKKLPAEVKRLQSITIPEVDEKTQKHISYSQFSVYNKCPFQWKLKYIDDIERYNPTIHTVFGTAMHETLQEYLTVMYEDSIKEADMLNLETLLLSNMRETYLEEIKKPKVKEFTSSTELMEFYKDGVEIISFLKKRRAAYFSKKGWYLVGIEMPIALPLSEEHPNVLFIGYLDLVMYHEPTNTLEIVDLKTSTRGWGSYKKQDQLTQSQLVLYKEVFSKQYSFPVEKIKTKFFILKRKLYENSEYPQKRIQEFVPASGKVKRKRFLQDVNTFINQAFTTNNTYQEKVYTKQPSDSNCKFCPFKDKPELCNKSI